MCRALNNLTLVIIKCVVHLIAKQTCAEKLIEIIATAEEFGIHVILYYLIQKISAAEEFGSVPDLQAVYTTMYFYFKIPRTWNNKLFYICSSDNS